MVEHQGIQILGEDLEEGNSKHVASEPVSGLDFVSDKDVAPSGDVTKRPIRRDQENGRTDPSEGTERCVEKPASEAALGKAGLYARDSPPPEGAGQTEKKEPSEDGMALPILDVKGTPLVLELCAGSAKLSAACVAEGMKALSVDHASNRRVPRHRIMNLDLSNADSWAVLYRIIETHQVVWVHVAPPCGTCSRARDRPLGPDHYGPRPLRSLEHPWGLPHLTDSERSRVELANQLTASFCSALRRKGICWSVENPGRSYMWELPPFIELSMRATFHDFDACMHGGLRAKWATFLSNGDLSDLCLRCDGSHEHLDWGVLPDGTFSTAEEAEYPDALCKSLAIIFGRRAIELGFGFSANLTDVHGKPVSDIATFQQPTKFVPPQISEFSYVREVRVFDLEQQGQTCSTFFRSTHWCKAFAYMSEASGGRFWNFCLCFLVFTGQSESFCLWHRVFLILSPSFAMFRTVH